MLEWLIETLSLPRLLLLAAIFVPLERVLALHERGWWRPGMLTDLAWPMANGLMLRGAYGLVLLAALSLREAVMPAGLTGFVAAQPVWLQAVAAAVLADLLYYWAHRLCHEVPALWRIHAVHHSIEQMDWLAAHRIHPLDLLLTKGPGYLLVILLGFDEMAILAAALVYMLHTVLLHANVRLKLRPLEGVLATPAFHHWHHAADRKGWNRNYAAQFSFYDRIFGTALLPRGEPPEAYGISDPVPPGLVGQLLYPFRPPEARPSQAPRKEASKPPMTSTA